MLKFKLKLSSGLVIEHIADTMIKAIMYVEDRYKSCVVGVELVN
jgi:hypothetical protein